MKRERVFVGVFLLLGLVGVAGFFARSSGSNPEAMHQPEVSPLQVGMSLKEVCADVDQEEDMVSSQVCTYGTGSSDAVYAHLRQSKVAPEVARLLEKTLPTRTISRAPGQNDAGIVAIEYHITSPGLVQIDVQFEGGADSYRMTQARGQVSLEITHSAD